MEQDFGPIQNRLVSFSFRSRPISIFALFQLFMEMVWYFSNTDDPGSVD
jgi:hypothetical protein